MSNEGTDEPTNVLIHVRMTDYDFDQLTDQTAEWHDKYSTLWVQQRGRFENVGQGFDRDYFPDGKWKWVYWVGGIGGNYAALLLARSFLEGREFDYEIAFDVADAGQYVIFTDYVSPVVEEAFTRYGR